MQQQGPECSPSLRTAFENADLQGSAGLGLQPAALACSRGSCLDPSASAMQRLLSKRGCYAFSRVRSGGGGVDASLEGPGYPSLHLSAGNMGSRCEVEGPGCKVSESSQQLQACTTIHGPRGLKARSPTAWAEMTSVHDGQRGPLPLPRIDCSLAPHSGSRPPPSCRCSAC